MGTANETGCSSICPSSSYTPAKGASISARERVNHGGMDTTLTSLSSSQKSSQSEVNHLCSFLSSVTEVLRTRSSFPWLKQSTEFILGDFEKIEGEYLEKNLCHTWFCHHDSALVHTARLFTQF